MCDFIKINNKFVLEDTCHIFPRTKHIDNIIKFSMNAIQRVKYIVHLHFKRIWTIVLNSRIPLEIKEYNKK